MFVLHTESSLGWGGQEIRVFTELEKLAGLGWRTALAAPAAARINHRARAAAIETYDLPFHGSFHPPSIRACRRLIQSLNPDIIVTHSSIDTWVTGWATRCLPRRPKLIRARHLSAPVGQALAYKWFADAVLTTSDSIMEILRAAGVSKPMQSIPTGVDRERFRPDPGAKAVMRAKWSIPSGRKVVGGVFVIRSWKGIYDFVRAASKMPDTLFVVAGEGPAREAMEKMARELGVLERITFLGHVDRPEEIFWAIDAAFFPSTANEGVPQAVLQAMATGTPIVASDLPSIREAAGDGAILVPPEDVDGFVSALSAILNDAAGAAQLAVLARERSARWDQTAMMQAVDGYYRVICQEGR